MLETNRQRYDTVLLWKDDSSITDNRSQTLTRLNHLVNRLQKKPEQYKKYNEEIPADLERDYIARVPFQQQNDTGRYMPLYGLVSPNKHDKIQRIFKDKAAQRGTSFNDMLLDGPDLLKNMLAILLRFG